MEKQVFVDLPETDKLMQLLNTLRSQLHETQKAYKRAKTALRKASQLSELQRKEFHDRLFKVETSLENTILQKNTQIERKRLQYNIELSQLNEDFAKLAKSMEGKSHQLGADTVVDRLVAVSKTLTERNDIISSLEEALERLSLDKERLRRERDYAVAQMKILESSRDLVEDVDTQASINPVALENKVFFHPGSEKADANKPATAEEPRDLDFVSGYFGTDSLNIPPLKKCLMKSEHCEASKNEIGTNLVENVATFIDDNILQPLQKVAAIENVSPVALTNTQVNGREADSNRSITPQVGVESLKKAASDERRGPERHEPDFASAEDVLQTLSPATNQLANREAPFYSRKVRAIVEGLMNDVEELRREKEGLETREIILIRSRERLEREVHSLQERHRAKEFRGPVILKEYSSEHQEENTDCLSLRFSGKETDSGTGQHVYSVGTRAKSIGTADCAESDVKGMFTRKYWPPLKSEAGLDRNRSPGQRVDMEGIRCLLNNLENVEGKANATKAKEVVNGMLEEIEGLKAENVELETRRSILERNRNLLEESIRQLQWDVRRCQERNCCAQSKNGVKCHSQEQDRRTGEDVQSSRS